MDAFFTNCVRYIVVQEAARGTGGVLYVRGDEWAYLLPHEWPEGQFRNAMDELFDHDNINECYVVVHIEDPSGTADARVYQIPKARAMAMLCCE